jgi:4-amino-4-deoxy-L-arabinose transferase-like glycosyltransferase
MVRHHSEQPGISRDCGPTSFSIWPACVLLLVSFALALTSAQVKSATFDEDAYIGKGTAIWMAGNYKLEVAHPPLGSMVSTLPLLTEPELAPPVDHRCWPDGTARSCGRELLFSRSDTQRVLLLARLPSMFLTLILAALVHRWATDVFGQRAGLIALALCALDPNILAHGRLVTLDLITTLVVFLNHFLFWRFWSHPTKGRLGLLGVALGIAGATQFATGLLVPIFVGASLAKTWHSMGTCKIPGLCSDSRWRRWAVTLGLLLAAGAVAAVVIWGIHSFSIGPVPRWQGIRLPAPAFFNELAFRLQEKSAAHNSFLVGRHYTGGWWPYFIVAFLVKTPLSTILLMALAVANLIRQGDGRFADLLLLAVPGVYFALASLSDFNRGYRYILPILPFLFVLGGRAACFRWKSPDDSQRSWLRHVPKVLLAWLVTANALIYPHYLAYFNELVGPSNGYRILVDSNLDWGQDLPTLEAYVTEHNLSSIYLSWFGESRPAQYDIPHRSIPSKPDELSDIHTRVYHPDYPPPGSYAISATNLQGLLFGDKDLFSYFLESEAVGHAGYSVMIYDVPRLLDPEAPPVTAALGNTQIDRVPSSVFEDFWHTNDLRLRWFDAETSCILPAEADVWYALNPEAVDGALLCPHWDEAKAVARVAERRGEGDMRLYRVEVDQEAQSQWLDKVARASSMVISDEIEFAPGEAPDLRREVRPPLGFGDRLKFVGYDVSAELLGLGETWQMATYWQVVTDGGRPIKAFVQVLDGAGNPRAQYDGFDVPAIGWRTGDILAQRHTLSIPEDLEPGRYWVQFGLYDAWTRDRLPVFRDDRRLGSRVLLPPLEAK